MKDVDPLQVDFSTLSILQTVYELKSFSAAAHKLDTNQSTISYAINRLRKVFGDPLFIRQANTIAATKRCLDIIAQVEPILIQYQEMVSPTTFDPLIATDTFTFSCSYYEQSVFLLPFLKKLRKLAPNLTIKIINSTTFSLDQLKQDKCDFLLSPMHLDANNLYQKILWEDHYVCAMDTKNPMAQQELTLKTLAQAQHVAVTYDGNWQPLYQQKLQEYKIKLNTYLELPNLSGLELSLQDADLISCVSAKIADTFGDNIVTKKMPIPIKFDSYLYWTARSHNNSAHQWMRLLISKELGLLLN